MFENDLDFDFDDDIIPSSFTPLDQTSSHGRLQNVRNTNDIDLKSNTNNDSHDTGRITKLIVPVPSLQLVADKAKHNTKFNFAIPVPNSENQHQTKKVVKRKFPGPAGILPDDKREAFHLEQLAAKRLKDSDAQENDDIICSQQSASVFDGGPWMEMMKEFRASSNRAFLPDVYNIKWIKDNALKKLIGEKVPFLAAIITNIEANSALTCINLMLKDLTGEIEAAILHTLYKDYSDELTIGSVIVLKKFGIFTAGNRKHYLTITPNNLIVIYTKNDSTLVELDATTDNQRKNNSENAHILRNTTNKVTKTCVQKINNEEIIAQVEQRMSFVSSNDLKDSTLDLFTRLKNESAEECFPVKQNIAFHSKENFTTSKLCNTSLNKSSLEKQNFPSQTMEIFPTTEPYNTSVLKLQHNESSQNLPSTSTSSFSATSQMNSRNIKITMGQKNINPVSSSKGQQSVTSSIKNDCLHSKTTENIFELDDDPNFSFDDIFSVDMEEMENKVTNADTKLVNESLLTNSNAISHSRIANNTNNNMHNDEGLNISHNRDEIRAREQENCMNEPIDNMKTAVDRKAETMKNKLSKFKFIPKSNDTKPMENVKKKSEVPSESLQKKRFEESFDNSDSVIISSSQLSVKTTNVEHNQIWKNVLDDLDTDSLFEDF